LKAQRIATDKAGTIKETEYLHNEMESELGARLCDGGRVADWVGGRRTNLIDHFGMNEEGLWI